LTRTTIWQHRLAIPETLSRTLQEIFWKTTIATQEPFLISLLRIRFPVFRLKIRHLNSRQARAHRTLSSRLIRKRRLRNLFADLAQIARYHPILCLIRIVAMALR